MTEKQPPAAETFKQQRYIAVDHLIADLMCKTLTLYARANQTYRPQIGDDFTNQSHCVYGDFLMESLLEALRPRIERFTQLKLIPTYSYYRVYTTGDELKSHTDRPACEVSVSLCLGYDYQGSNYQWALTMGPSELAQEPGSGVIYRGLEVPHSRPKMAAPEGSWHAQVFLHYVEKGGKYEAYSYDERPSLYR